MAGINFNEAVVGTCGNCGGPVVVPSIWMGVNKPTPTCKSCGATARRDYGPTLPMNDPPEMEIRYHPHRIMRTDGDLYHTQDYPHDFRGFF